MRTNGNISTLSNYISECCKLCVSPAAHRSHVQAHRDGVQPARETGHGGAEPDTPAQHRAHQSRPGRGAKY